MNFEPMNLNAYFQRIGYSGPRVADLTVLQEIVLAETTSIPFENLDVLAGREISLAPTAFEEKLVHSGRGGYCFEGNALLGRVLVALGFAV